MSRKSIAFAAALLAWGVGSIGMLPRVLAEDAEKAPKKRLLQLGTSRGEEAIKKTLEGDKTNLEFIDTQLKEALTFIGDKHKLDIQYDVVALRDAAIDPTAIPVSINIKDVHLESALKLILSQNNLTYIIQDEVLQITTKDKANATLITEIYDVRDLTPLRDSRQPDFDGLIRLLTSLIAAQTWSEVGGPGTIAGFGPGSLIVSQTQEVHQEIANLLRLMRGVAEEVESGKIQEAVLNGREGENLRFEKVLQEKKSLEGKDLTVFQALAQLFKSQPVDMAYDQVALRDAAVDPATLTVDGDFKDLTLRSLLNLLLSQHNLTYVIQDEVLLITTKDKANTTLTTRVYPVNDLLKISPNEEPSSDEVDAGINSLVELVTRTIAAQTWAEVGGPGTIEAFDKDGYMLVVSQTGEVHDEISDLLKNLRAMHKQQLDGAAREQAAPKTPETVVLKVYDLKVTAPGAPAMTPQEVTEVVKSLTDAKAWNTPDAYIRGATGKLIVKQTPTVHRQIEKLLDQLGAAVPKMPAGGTGGIGNRPSFGSGGSF